MTGLPFCGSGFVGEFQSFVGRNQRLGLRNRLGGLGSFRSLGRLRRFAGRLYELFRRSHHNTGQLLHYVMHFGRGFLVILEAHRIQAEALGIDVQGFVRDEEDIVLPCGTEAPQSGEHHCFAVQQDLLYIFQE